MKKYLSNERGLSLVEVVAAVALLTIILTAVYYILIQNSKLNALNSTNFSASAVARDISAQITTECSNVKFNNVGNPSPLSCFKKHDNSLAIPINLDPNDPNDTFFKNNSNYRKISTVDYVDTNKKFKAMITIMPPEKTIPHNQADNNRIEKFYTLRVVTINIWEENDDIFKKAPKATTYTYQREVNQ